MKIATYNANSLRKRLPIVLDWLDKQKPDVLCLQEIKSRQDQLEASHLQSIQGYFLHTAWNPAKRPGYSGTATWARLAPLSVELGLGHDDFDGEGRVITR